jgi:hypothetical protein
VATSSGTLDSISWAWTIRRLRFSKRMISSEEATSRFFGTTDGGAVCLWSRAGRAYRDGWARMAELAKDDPLRAGTIESTDARLMAFYDRLLARDPLNIRALWMVIGRDVRWTSNSLTERSWKALLELGDFEPRWLVEHSFWVQTTSGKDTAPLLADVLRRNRMLEAVRPTLLELREEGPRWVARVVVLSSSDRTAGG